MTTRSEGEPGPYVSEGPKRPKLVGRLRDQRLLITVGFLMVAVGSGAEYLTVSVGAPGIYGWSYNVFGIANTVGYVLVAWATWALFKWIDGLPTPGAGLTKVLKLFGVANLVFAIGLVSVTYYWSYWAIRHLPDISRASKIIPFTGAAQLLGFLLVSVGFWIAASKLQIGAAHTDSTEPLDIGTYV